MKRPIVLLLLALVAFVALAGCGDNPAADGRYATHDRGQNNRP
jgi:hypothetical protein